MEVDDTRKIFYSQEELNATYLGPPFRLNYRYTQLLVNFYICWMYAISMPILPLIGAISFFCSYWIGEYTNKLHIARIFDDHDITSTQFVNCLLINLRR